MMHTDFPFTSKKMVSALFVAVLVTTGCAQKLSQEQCQTFNFYQVGLADGNAGKTLNEFAKYQKDCNEYKITLDRRQYENGWRQGNQSFCQPSTAFSIGKQGGGFPAACTDYSTADLRNEYNRGYQIFQRVKVVESQIADVDKQMHGSDAIRAELDKSRARILELNKLRDATQDAQQKQNYQNEIYMEEDRIKQLNTELIVKATLEATQHDKLQAKRDALVRELQTLKATN